MTASSGPALQGRRILVTRPRAQAARLTELLEAYGAETVTLPDHPDRPPGGLDAARRGDPLARRLPLARLHERERRGGVPRAPPPCRADAAEPRSRIVAAIGPETAEALRREGLEPDVVPAEFTGRGTGRRAPRPGRPRRRRAAGARRRGAGRAAARARGARRPRSRSRPPIGRRSTREGARAGPRAPRGAADRRRHVHELVDGPRVRRPLRAGRRGPAPGVTWSWPPSARSRPRRPRSTASA